MARLKAVDTTYVRVVPWLRTKRSHPARRWLDSLLLTAAAAGLFEGVFACCLCVSTKVGYSSLVIPRGLWEPQESTITTRRVDRVLRRRRNQHGRPISIEAESSSLPMLPPLILRVVVASKNLSKVITEFFKRWAMTMPIMFVVCRFHLCNSYIHYIYIYIYIYITNQQRYIYSFHVLHATGTLLYR